MDVKKGVFYTTSRLREQGIDGFARKSPAAWKRETSSTERERSAELDERSSSGYFHDQCQGKASTKVGLWKGDVAHTDDDVSRFRKSGDFKNLFIA